jgi:hypothetical protein
VAPQERTGTLIAWGRIKDRAAKEAVCAREKETAEKRRQKPRTPRETTAPGRLKSFEKNRMANSFFSLRAWTCLLIQWQTGRLYSLLFSGAVFQTDFRESACRAPL